MSPSASAPRPPTTDHHTRFDKQARPPLTRSLPGLPVNAPDQLVRLGPGPPAHTLIPNSVFNSQLFADGTPMARLHASPQPGARPSSGVCSRRMLAVRFLFARTPTCMFRAQTCILRAHTCLWYDAHRWCTYSFPIYMHTPSWLTKFEWCHSTPPSSFTHTKSARAHI